MCGFVGIYRLDHHGENDLEALNLMSERIQHRGPDQQGTWADRDAGISMAHRRLSILDLSAAGKQPMVSPSERYVIAFNGEIYNHLALRSELERFGGEYRWRGHSDTETLLAAIDQWGLATTLERTTGMFAFALWDREERELVLARDRMGEKPLYYGWQGGSLLFGSELKALRAFPGFESQIDQEALSLYMRLSYVPAPHSIYQGIFKLEPGHLIRFSKRRKHAKAEAWWDIREVISTAATTRTKVPPASDVVEHLEQLLRSSIKRQLLADVPVGASLSGGVDSSAVVALMQDEATSNVKTFSIGSQDADYDESEYAAAVAKHLGTDHTAVRVSPEEALEVIPCLPQIYDEPFADASQIPTLLVSRLARQQVTVSLSGDGGDELFAGYNRYEMTASLWGKLSAIPMPLRKTLAKGIQSIGPETWSRWLSRLPTGSRALGKWDRWGDKLHKGSLVLGSSSLDEVYLGLISRVENPVAIVKDAKNSLPRFLQAVEAIPSLNGIERMMAADLMGFLPDDVLCKVDRAAMSVSLETRIPMLDHRIVEYAWSLPLELKMRNGVSKWPLREVLYRYVPKELIERPKRGFALPIDQWLRTSLRDWAEALLNPNDLIKAGYLDVNAVRAIWLQHLSGKRNNGEALWNILTFQAWLKENNKQVRLKTHHLSSNQIYSEA